MNMDAVVVETNSKGKGKIRARKDQIEKGIPFVPRIAALAHSDSEYGGKSGDPSPRYPEFITEANSKQIPKYSVNNPVELTKALNCIRQAVPVILRNTSLLPATSNTGSLQARWSEWSAGSSGTGGGGGGVSAACGPALKGRVLLSAEGKDRFMEVNPNLNIFGGFYYVREPETEVVAQNFEEFSQCAHSWKTRKVLLKMALMRQSIKSAAEHIPPQCLEDVSPTGREDLETRIDWQWMTDTILKPCSFGGVFQVRMECGMRDCLQPCHYAGFETLQLQVSGRRRVLLLDPSQSFSGLYPYPSHHPLDGFSMVDLERPDCEEWPLLKKLRGQCAILHPGDLLYLPMWWWRHIQELEDNGTVLNFCLHQGERYRRPNQVLLPLGRYLEQLVMQTVERLEEVKHWLGIVARAEEAEWIDLGSVKGHRLIKMVQRVRDEVDSSLGLGKWQEFLHTLIDRRLESTPWLNVDFREPLYLHDRPVQLRDTRTEEEQKFPELFYHKLKDEGYNVERTPMSVFNPQHPDFIHKDNPNYKNQMQRKN